MANLLAVVILTLGAVLVLPLSAISEDRKRYVVRYEALYIGFTPALAPFCIGRADAMLYLKLVYEKMYENGNVYVAAVDAVSDKTAGNGGTLVNCFTHKISANYKIPLQVLDVTEEFGMRKLSNGKMYYMVLSEINIEGAGPYTKAMAGDDIFAFGSYRQIRKVILPID